MKKVIIALAATAALGAPALAQNAPAGVYVENFVHWGNGCPAGTVAQNLSPDAKALTLIFDNFVVDSSQVNGREQKKSCQVAVQLHVPAGWAYTLFSVDYRGYAALDRNGESRLRSWYSIDQSESIRISNLKMQGPYNGDYVQRAWVPLDALPWLTCNRGSSIVSINTEIMTQGRQALMTVDSLDGELRQHYGIAWRPCTNSASWAGRCTAVLESQWGSDMNKFTGIGGGIDHTQAKNAARTDALRQCEAERSRLRPLVQALSRCVVDTSQCIATPQ